MDTLRAEKIYDRLAPLYDLWSILTETYPQQRALRAAELRAGESVLEVGIGTGRLFAELSRLAGLKRCIGLDLSSRMLQRARHRLPTSSGRTGVLCRADAGQSPFPSGTFDVVLSCYVLDLLSEGDIRRVLGEFRRIIKPEGRLVLLDMAKQAPAVNTIWMWVFRRAPALVGRCRPVRLAPMLAATNWRLSRQEQVSQCGFRSELILADPTCVEKTAA